MFGAIVEFLLQILTEALLQVVGELLFELGFTSLSHSLRRGRTANPVLAGIGFCMIGAVAGLVTCWLLPRPLVRPGRVLQGLSLLLAPIVTGAAMQTYGSWQRDRGRDTSLLATFWGGALFAFVMGVARRLCLSHGWIGGV